MLDLEQNKNIRGTIQICEDVSCWLFSRTLQNLALWAPLSPSSHFWPSWWSADENCLLRAQPPASELPIISIRIGKTKAEIGGVRGAAHWGLPA